MPEDLHPESATPDYGELALVMSGGGARAAYQVGLLRYLSRTYPELSLPILSGVSAGAVNAVHLAQHHGTFRQAVDELSSLWGRLTTEQVFVVNTAALTGTMARTGLRLASGGLLQPGQFRSMVNTAPLRAFMNEAFACVDGQITGIDYNLHRGTLRAIALSATSYTTAQSIVWIQGRDISGWERPMRRSVHTQISVDHVMSSTALPLFFPAVQIGNEWYGDGGIRMTAPLSPALHLGAKKILAVSTRYARTPAEANRREIEGYPPPAQVLGVLYNAVFLDMVDQDVHRLERMNQLLDRLPPDDRDGLRIVDLMVIRPSRDLGMMASGFETKLPRIFRFLSRAWGTRETSSPDLLSMVLFESDYLQRLMDLGEEDAEMRADEIEAFIKK
ncbi:patatin-like phospholipase family protein [soil metagenome]